MSKGEMYRSHTRAIWKWPALLIRLYLELDRVERFFLVTQHLRPGRILGGNTADGPFFFPGRRHKSKCFSFSTAEVSLEDQVPGDHPVIRIVKIEHTRRYLFRKKILQRRH